MVQQRDELIPRPASYKKAARTGDGDGRRKKVRRDNGHSGKKYACPYFKRDPKKYCKWTSCPGPGWDEIHRVKTHLYRRHAPPPQCPRCWGVFKTEDILKAHLQQDPPCEVGRKALVEGFSKEQEKKLRSRKKAQPNMTDKDKWREIYFILFPDDDRDSIPSAYYDENDQSETDSPSTGELEDYATFVRKEMPTLVRRELENLFEQDEFKDVDEKLRPRVADIVMNLQPRLLELYKQSQTPLSEYGPASADADPGLTSHGTSTNSTDGTQSTPGTASGTDANELEYLDASEMAQFDVNSMGGGFVDWSGGQDASQEFDWDQEFDQLLNPVLFAPQIRGYGEAAAAGLQSIPESAGKRKYQG
ncbi:hypothetical protein B0H66DRAFT_475781 [Apodospora peruviana]|uniref:C2H2-type domain-containing protein n=1 Tax=Apodospora peruviana TaxID=516989 RepID=A0AAE0I6M2_9PEZI|nr:hypothetical protein B0H66DRAFT_475781 [Apodospora peruviana]